MQCIRIEHNDGIGMFKTYKGAWRDMFSELRECNNIMNICPEVYYRHNRDFNTPEEDGLDLNLYGKNWFCAYKNLNQLKKWINSDEIKIIIAEGYKVLLLDVSEFQEGKDQIIYTKESIQSSNNITNLFA